MPNWSPSPRRPQLRGQSTSRYSCTAGSTARWSTEGLAPGQYTAWIYTISDANSDPAVKVTYTHDGTATDATLDQRNTAAGWHQIGDTYTLGSGDQSIKITASGTGCARADSVRFVRTG